MAARVAFAVDASSFVRRPRCPVKNMRRRHDAGYNINAPRRSLPAYFTCSSSAASSSSKKEDDATYRRIISEDKPWDSLEEPLTEEDLQNVRDKLPKPIADFVIRRVTDAPVRRDTVLYKYSRESVDVNMEIDEEVEREYEDYLYENEYNEKRNLFLSRESEADLESRRIGYGTLAVLLLLVIAKFLSALVGFFISFTFSFLAIFALSAGIFIVFVLFRF